MIDPAALARLVIFCYAHERRYPLLRPVLRAVRLITQARIRAMMAATVWRVRKEV